MEDGRDDGARPGVSTRVTSLRGGTARHGGGRALPFKFGKGGGDWERARRSSVGRVGELGRVKGDHRAPLVDVPDLAGRALRTTVNVLASHHNAPAGGRCTREHRGATGRESAVKTWSCRSRASAHGEVEMISSGSGFRWLVVVATSAALSSVLVARLERRIVLLLW